MHSFSWRSAARTAFSGCLSCVGDGSAISSHTAEAVDRRYRVAESNQPCRLVMTCMQHPDPCASLLAPPQRPRA